MGFLEDITQWYWNIIVWNHIVTAAMGCWKAGGWGIFFNDDDGYMMRRCYNIWDGLTVTFPVEYESEYAEVPSK